MRSLADPAARPIQGADPSEVIAEDSTERPAGLIRSASGISCDWLRDVVIGVPKATVYRYRAGNHHAQIRSSRALGKLVGLAGARYDSPWDFSGSGARLGVLSAGCDRSSSVGAIANVAAVGLASRLAV